MSEENINQVRETVARYDATNSEFEYVDSKGRRHTGDAARAWEAYERSVSQFDDLYRLLAK